MGKTKAEGTTLTLTSKATTPVVSLIGSLSNIGEVAPSADEIEVTTLDSDGGYKEFLQGMKDAGEVPVSGYMDATTAKNQNKLITYFDTGETVGAEIEFPDGTTVGFDCYIKAYTMGGAEIGGAVAFGATLRVTGKPTVTWAT